MKILRIGLFLTSILVLLPTTSRAQDGDARVQEIVSEISPENDIALFSLFDIQVGTTIYLYAESDDIDTWIGICGLECKQPLVENDDIDTDNYNSALSYTFETSGDYVIFVTDCCRSEAAGGFRLLIGINAPDVLNGSATPTGAQIVVPPKTATGGLADTNVANTAQVQEAFGEVNADAQFVLYNIFDAKAGETIYLYVESLSIDPHLFICDLECGQIFAGNDNISPENSNSAVVYTFPTDGAYTIVVSDCCSTDAFGSFRILFGYDDPQVLTGEATPTGASIAQPFNPSTAPGEDTTRTESADVDDLTAQGFVLTYNGSYSEALELFITALDLARTINYQQGEGLALTGIGTVYENQLQYSTALDYFQQALVIWQQIGLRELEGGILLNIGSIYSAQGLYDQSLDHHQQALSIFRDLENLEWQGLALTGIGLVYQYWGNDTQALSHFEQALEIAVEIGDRDQEGSTLESIGLVYFDQGQYDQALEYYQRTLEVRKQTLDREAEGNIHNSIGSVYAELGEYDRALDHLFQSLEIARDYNNRREASFLNDIAAVYSAQGQYDQALDYFQEALALVRSNGDLKAEQFTLGSIGVIYLEQEQYDQALPYLQQALDIARDIEFQQGEFIWLVDLGTLYTGQMQVDQAINYYSQAIEVNEAIHADIRLESSQRFFAEEYVYLYDALVDLFVLSDPEQALHYSERGRARSFLFQLGNERLNFGDGADSGLLDEWQAKRDEVAALRAARVDLFSQARPSQDALSELNEAIAQAEVELSQLEDRIAIANPEVSQFVQVGVPSLADLQVTIPDDSTMLLYYIIPADMFDPGRVLAFVLTSNSLEIVSLPPTPQNLTNAIEAFRGDENLTTSLQQLHDWLIMPVENLLTGSNSSDLFIVPHGVLNYLPFAALTSDGTHYLSDRFSISYVPSATIYKLLSDNRPTAPTDEKWLILGNPVSSDETLPPLTGAQAEAEAIGTLLNNEVYVREAATEQLVREQIGQSDGIHISAHGVFDTNNSLSTYLALSPSGANGTETDGFLEVREIYALPLQEHAPMIVLSACETGVNETTAGDEFQGLTRAFLLSGARVVLASQWAVEDEATAVLMTAFYQNRSAGMSDAEALAAAQRTVRENVEHPEWASPFYWAAFQLVGLAN